MLKKFMMTLEESGAENLKSGFWKAGISPLNGSVVLERLPTPPEKLGGLPQAVTESFIEHLESLRRDDTVASRRKMWKVSAAPGKSISQEDLQQTWRNMYQALLLNQMCQSWCENMRREQGQNILVKGYLMDYLETTIQPHWTRTQAVEMQAHQCQGHVKGKVLLEATMGLKWATLLLYNIKELLPGQVKLLQKLGAEVSVMQRSGVNWCWPRQKDQIWY